VNSYKIEIPNDKINSYKLVTFIILTLNFIGFGYVFIRTSSTATMVSIIGIILSAVPWLYYLLNKKHLQSPLLETSLFAAAFMWLYFGNTWMGILIILFAIIGFIANKKPIIIFSEKGIQYPSFPSRFYLWDEVAHVILKDDILTIDFKNNKLLQFNIEKNIADAIDSNKFNNYCLNLVQSTN
jgi:hypothetical protein